MYEAKVIADSIYATRIVSVAATYPRFIHAELMTHRAFARNAASSRAIPFIKFDKNGDLVSNCTYAMLQRNPVYPKFLGLEQAGMQAGAELEGERRDEALLIIDKLLQTALESAKQLVELGLHKSIVNRYLEPWSWITTLVTATEWNNFFRLRCHPDAERHFQLIAGMMRDAIKASTPEELTRGDWHLPYVHKEDIKSFLDYGLTFPSLQKISAGRCARLSYLTQEGKRDIREDIKLADRLILRPDDVIHASPLEHVAYADEAQHRSGPFIGWAQFRKTFRNENVPGCNP